MNRIILCVLATLFLAPNSAHATSSPSVALTADEINRERQLKKDETKAEKDLNSIIPDDYGEFNDFMEAEADSEADADSITSGDRTKEEDARERQNVRQVYKPQPNLAMRRAIKDDRVDDGYVQGLIEQRAMQQDLVQ